MATRKTSAKVDLKKKAEKLNESFMMDISLPADFSFHQYKELKPVGCQHARSTRLGEPPERSVVKKKFLTKGVWLNNNQLRSLKGLDTFVAGVLENTVLLTLLDLSFNYITTIDPVIAKFCNLTVLYFHGNQISDIEEVGKLRHLKKLRNLTFLGNPIANLNYYRKLVVAVVPGLVHLDHYPVLESFKREPVPPNALKHLKAIENFEKVPCITQEEADTLSREADKALKQITPTVAGTQEVIEEEEPIKADGKNDGIRNHPKPTQRIQDIKPIGVTTGMESRPTYGTGPTPLADVPAVGPVVFRRGGCCRCCLQRS